VYCSPNVTGVIKSRTMRLAGHVERLGERKGAYRVLVEKPERKRLFGRPRIILKWIFSKWDVKARTELI